MLRVVTLTVGSCEQNDDRSVCLELWPIERSCCCLGNKKCDARTAPVRLISACFNACLTPGFKIEGSTQPPVALGIHLTERLIG